MTDAQPLDVLMRWYRSHCDGSWEHQHGIWIETLDNPGWRLVIDLNDTELAKAPFESVQSNIDDQNLWWRCWRTDTSFNAACGPEILTIVIKTFIAWVEMNASKPE